MLKQPSSPLVSVVMPFYNDPYVGEAIESVLAQSYGNVELIVVNDGSTRETERLLPYTDRAIVLNKANGGTASALNAGFRAASGEYIAWLSSDDRFEREKLERQVRFMEEKKAWISHTAFRCMNERGEAEGPPIRLPFAEPYLFYQTFLTGNVINGCTVMMRKALFNRLGGFDEKLRFTHDYDLWVRALLAGFPIPYLDEPLTMYRRHSAMGTFRHKKDIDDEFRQVSEGSRPRLARLLEAIEPLPSAVRRR
ncbi:glycosyltransferase [Cohnella lubricantis]|uniref:Glycosyltransferase n=1 Tax=Cohnella lubricantis TaxID=2163172 RepID=A0A841TIV6_9BACL|nr:glycosyltransferase [Cohnella lubricantis]MBB6679789.1 glycosyltransferase [Cohnella lubricantis]MBP2120344.1 glycosyltransferase involved in cell wall biosynthesis [Cohnella lubricantis]